VHSKPIDGDNKASEAELPKSTTSEPKIDYYHLNSLEGGKRKVGTEKSPEGQPPLKQIKIELLEGKDEPIDMFEDDGTAPKDTVPVSEASATAPVKMKKPRPETDGATVKVKKKKMKTEKQSGTDTDGDAKPKKVKTKVKKHEKPLVVDDSESKVSSTDDFVKVKEPKDREDIRGKSVEKRVRQIRDDEGMKERRRPREFVKEKRQEIAKDKPAEKIQKKEKDRSSKEKQFEEPALMKKHRTRKEFPPVDIEMEEVLRKKKKHEHGSKKIVKIPKQTALRDPSPDMHLELEDEPELGEEAIMVDPPELSKWEKEEYSSDMEPRRRKIHDTGRKALPR
jgi:hypothetical protein